MGGKQPCREEMLEQEQLQRKKAAKCLQAQQGDASGAFPHFMASAGFWRPFGKEGPSYRKPLPVLFSLPWSKMVRNPPPV